MLAAAPRRTPLDAPHVRRRRFAVTGFTGASVTLTGVVVTSVAGASVAGAVGCAAPSPRCPRAPAPRIECTYESGGESKTVRIEPAPDPYRVPELAAGDRFAIKFVYLTHPAELASLRVYAFQLNDDGPLILHEAKYVPPFAPNAGGFTGRQRVYDARGGELAYACRWFDR